MSRLIFTLPLDGVCPVTLVVTFQVYEDIGQVCQVMFLEITNNDMRLAFSIATTTVMLVVVMEASRLASLFVIMIVYS